MKTEIDINRIYDIVEAALTEITGSRPNATERDHGLDSLGALYIAFRVEEETGITGIADNHSINHHEMTPLEMTIHLHRVAIKEMDKQSQFQEERKKLER